MIPEEDFGDIVETPRIRLRDYQLLAKQRVEEGWKTFSRQLLDMATGTGKSSIMASLAADEWERGGRTLVLENRDALVRQTAKRIADETGLTTDIEMAGEHASPFAAVVVASVPTLSRDNRLTGFAENHFQLLITDEVQHGLSRSFMKVANYFHYGAASLADGWQAPVDETNATKARLLGVTATPELGSGRSLGELYQSIAFSYDFWTAVNEGWLVEPTAVMEPLKANFRGLRATRTANGSDYNPTEVAERMVPVIDALAEQIVRLASERKTMAYMPSINTASLLADAINARGLRAVFVSGVCLDRGPKTDEFVAHGKGIALVTSAMYVEGFDCPDVDCVFAGLTKSKGYFKQKIGRATRPLPGILDGLETAEERRAAIAASAKPNFLVIDPFCRCEDIPLCDFYDLFTDKPEIKERMKVMGDASQETAKEAERDFIKALEKEARKHSRKQTRVINPLLWSLSLGGEKLAAYQPKTAWDAQPITVGQRGFLEKQHIDVTGITSKGMAQMVIGTVLQRMKLGRATPVQLDLMLKFHVDEKIAYSVSVGEASALIQSVIDAKKSQREATA